MDTNPKRSHSGASMQAKSTRLSTLGRTGLNKLSLTLGLAALAGSVAFYRIGLAVLPSTTPWWALLGSAAVASGYLTFSALWVGGTYMSGRSSDTLPWVVRPVHWALVLCALPALLVVGLKRRWSRAAK